MDEISTVNDFDGDGGVDGVDVDMVANENSVKMRADILENGELTTSMLPNDECINPDTTSQINGILCTSDHPDWIESADNSNADFGEEDIITSEELISVDGECVSGFKVPVDENNQPEVISEVFPDITENCSSDSHVEELTVHPILTNTCPIEDFIPEVTLDVVPQLPPKNISSVSEVNQDSEPIYNIPRSLKNLNDEDGCVVQSIDDDTEDLYDLPAAEEDVESDVDEVDKSIDSYDDAENVYEVIKRVGGHNKTSTPTSDVTKTRTAPTVNNDDQSIFKRCSLVDEVMDEVERVQQKHDQVIQELNLDIENMIMPLSPIDRELPHAEATTTTTTTMTMTMSASASCNCTRPPPRVPPHGTLIPNAYSAYSAPSCSPADLEANVRRNSHANRVLPPLPVDSDSISMTPRVAENEQRCTRSSYSTAAKDGERSRRSSDAIGQRQPLTPSLPVSGVKHWLSRLPSLSSFREKKGNGRSSSDRFSWRWSFGYAEEPLYMLYDDTHRVRTGNKYNSEDGIYEDIDRQGIHQTLPQCVTGSYTSFTKVPSVEHLRDRKISFNSNCPSGESNDDRSDSDSLRSVGALSVSSFKGKILNIGKKLGRHNEEKMKDSSKTKQAESAETKPEGKLARLFSRRKGYDLGRLRDRGVVVDIYEAPEDERLPELRLSSHSNPVPTILPPPPSDLSSEQIKRRYIVGTLVHSENSYIASLKRLVQDYKKPLEECVPPIVNANKISALFHRVPEVLQIHVCFGISLGTCVRQWDKEEKIGDVFINTFSKTSVLDVYSDFINNFSSSMELAKQETKRKNAFTDFLKVKQITSHDRLSFFGLMVKPVQRFPQFILLLQDLLRHTPSGHHDRLSLQLALTQMEMLAELLNERKRESDQARAVRSILGHVSAKSAARSLSEGTRYLLRQDTLTQLMFNQNGQLTKFKERCLFVLNDLLVCVSVTNSASTDGKGRNKSQRYSLKWAVPLCEVEVQEDASPILNRMVYAMATGQSSAIKGATDEIGDVQSLYQDLNDLIHDFEVISRVSSLVSTFRKHHETLSIDVIHQVSQSVQKAIQKKDEEVKWLDSCCLQLTVPLKTKTGKVQRDLVIFQTKNMDTKNEWLTDVRLAQLALDANNSTAWDFPDQERRPSTKVPLFVKAVPVLSSHVPMEVKCGCYHKTVSSRLPLRPQNFVWLCSTDGFNSHISVHTLRQMGIREVFSFDMMECRISAMESVPGVESPTASISLLGDTVWMGTESRRVILYCGGGSDNFQEVGSANMSASVLHIKYHLGQVYVALTNGTVALFKRSEGQWQLKNFQVITLGSDPVTCLLPVNSFMYCGCGRQVWVLDSVTAKIVHIHSVHHDHLGSVYSMAHSGIGLWLNLRNTPLVCLYHAETFQHLQDINVTSSVKRVITEECRPRAPRNIYVTVLSTSWGLLWVGTNVGVVLSIPLPRLQGMPMLGRRANMAYHAHVGPVSMVLVLQNPLQPSYFPTTPVMTSPINDCGDSTQNSIAIEDDRSSGEFHSQTLRMPGMLFQGDSLSNFGAGAKTLPRGWRPPSLRSPGDNDGDDVAACDVYGLYGNLLNVKDDSSMTPIGQDLRCSDPELIPSLVSTLDRRLRLHSGRPRSLDLTNLTVLGGGCSAVDNVLCCPSSGSEDGSSATISFAEIPETLVEEPSTEVPQITGSTSSVTTTTVVPAAKESPKKDQTSTQRSLLTLVGGRGYVDLRNTTPAGTTASSVKDVKVNSVNIHNDAFIVMWEMKV